MFAFTFVLLAASAAVLAAAVLRERRVAQRATAVEERDRQVTKVEAELSLLETRATFLRQEIDSLEEDRQALLVIVPEVARGERLRKKLSGRTAQASTASAKLAAR